MLCVDTDKTVDDCINPVVFEADRTVVDCGLSENCVVVIAGGILVDGTVDKI